MSLSLGKCVCLCVCECVSQSVSQSVRMLTSRWRFRRVYYICICACPLFLCLCLCVGGLLKVQRRTLVKSTQMSDRKWRSQAKGLSSLQQWLNEWMNEWAADWASECEESEWMTKCATGWLTDWYAGILEGIYQRTLHSTSSWNAYFFVLNASFHFLSSLIFILPRDSYFATIHPPFVTLLWKVGTLEIFCKIYCNKSMKHPWGVI